MPELARLGRLVRMTDKETFIRTISGREVEFNAPTDAQYLVIARLMRVGGQLDRDDDPDQTKIKGTVEQLSKILDIIDSMVVYPADRDWLESKIIEGNLDMSELMSAFQDKGEDAALNRATKRAVAKKKTTGTSRAKTR